MWCIELVREGCNLPEHVERFVDNGKYSEIRWSDHIIIIDFRSKRVNKKSDKYNKVWFVQHTSNFEELTVKSGRRSSK